MATNILLNVSKDEEARAYYESELIFQADQRGRIRQAVEEAKYEMAVELLKNGVSIEVIAKSSGLSIEKIKTLIGSSTL